MAWPSDHSALYWQEFKEYMLSLSTSSSQTTNLNNILGYIETNCFNPGYGAFILWNKTSNKIGVAAYSYDVYADFKLQYYSSFSGGNRYEYGLPSTDKTSQYNNTTQIRKELIYDGSSFTLFWTTGDNSASYYYKTSAFNFLSSNAACYPTPYEWDIADFETYSTKEIPVGIKRNGSTDNFVMPINISLVPIEKPKETIYNIKFGNSTESFVPKFYQGEKGRYLKLLDSGNFGNLGLKNLTYSQDLTSGSFSGDTAQIPDATFNLPGLVEGKIYGTGGQASTVLKKVFFKVEDLPRTKTSVTPTGGGSNKTIKLNGQKNFNFIWKLTNTSSNPTITVQDDTNFRCIEVWTDTNVDTRYVIAGSSNVFVIPAVSTMGLYGTFHGLLRFGDGSSTDTVAAEFIWNFDT